MPKTTIFVGSSSSARSQAKAIVEELTSATVKFLPWWEHFTAGRSLLEELDSLKNQVNGALLVFSPESETTLRGRHHEIPNLNVLFEFGYFYGHFGKEKVAMLKYGDFYLPSDLGGYIHIFGSKGFTRGGARRINDRTKIEFERWIQQL
jgi:predicted nucleotide-binding protein